MNVRPDTPKVKKFWRLFTMKPAPTLDSPEKVATGLLPAAVTPWTTTWPVTVAIPATTSWLMVVTPLMLIEPAVADPLGLPMFKTPILGLPGVDIAPTAL